MEIKVSENDLSCLIQSLQISTQFLPPNAESLLQRLQARKRRHEQDLENRLSLRWFPPVDAMRGT